MLSYTWKYVYDTYSVYRIQLRCMRWHESCKFESNVVSLSWGCLLHMRMLSGLDWYQTQNPFCAGPVWEVLSGGEGGFGSVKLHSNWSEKCYCVSSLAVSWTVEVLFHVAWRMWSIFLTEGFLYRLGSIVGCRNNCRLCLYLGLVKLSKLNFFSARSLCNKIYSYSTLTEKIIFFFFCY